MTDGPRNNARKTRSKPSRPGNPEQPSGPAVNTAANQRGKPFQLGRSGNPSGKPRGARHRTSILAEQLMQTDAAEIVKAVIQKAKEGDMVAAKIVIDRIAPIRKGAPISVELPSIKTAEGVADAMNALLREMAAGEITPAEASIIAAVIDVRRRTIETVEHEARIAHLESNQQAK
jgi:hypothetical protein